VRLAVLFAGPLFQPDLRIFIFLIGFRVGWPDRVVVNTVVPGTPAESAGLNQKT